MNIKKILKYFLIIGFICLAGYLTFDLISENIAQKTDVQNFCLQKCNYNESSLFWEFSGDSGVKGFTTKDECFSYCSKAREGFVLRFVNDSYASLTSSSFLSDFFKFIHLK